MQIYVCVYILHFLLLSLHSPSLSLPFLFFLFFFSFFFLSLSLSLPLLAMCVSIYTHIYIYISPHSHLKGGHSLSTPPRIAKTGGHSWGPKSSSPRCVARPKFPGPVPLLGSVMAAQQVRPEGYGSRPHGQHHFWVFHRQNRPLKNHHSSGFPASGPHHTHGPVGQHTMSTVSSHHHRSAVIEIGSGPIFQEDNIKTPSNGCLFQGCTLYLFHWCKMFGLMEGGQGSLKHS